MGFEGMWVNIAHDMQKARYLLLAGAHNAGIRVPSSGHSEGSG
jgi:hypothetical protein